MSSRTETEQSLTKCVAKKNPKNGTLNCLFAYFMSSNAKVELWNNKLCVILSTDDRFGPTTSVEPKRGHSKATTFIYTRVKSYSIIQMHVHVHTHTHTRKD